MTLAQRLIAARLTGDCEWSWRVVGTTIDRESGEEAAVVILRCGESEGERWMVIGDRLKREPER